jgi:hypothetical protein
VVNSKTTGYLEQNGGVPLDHPRRCMAHTLLGIASGATSEAVKLNAIRDALDAQ